MLDYVPKTKMSKINGISGKYKELQLQQLMLINISVILEKIRYIFSRLKFQKIEKKIEPQNPVFLRNLEAILSCQDNQHVMKLTLTYCFLQPVPPYLLQLGTGTGHWNQAPRAPEPGTGTGHRNQAPDPTSNQVYLSLPMHLIFFNRGRK